MEPRGTRLRRWITSSRAANGNQTGKTIPARCVAGTTPTHHRADYHQRATATKQLPAAGRELANRSDSTATHQKKILATEEAPKAQTFGGRADLEAAQRASQIPQSRPRPRSRRQISRPLPGARSNQRRPANRGRGDLAEVWAGLGWVGGSRGAMASAQAPSSSSAPSRKEHLEAGKKRVCLSVACWLREM